MADLTPELLDGLARLAVVRDDIDKRMSECIASLDVNSEYTGDHFAMDSEMLRAVCLEFMDHATSLVQAAKELARVRDAMRRLIADAETVQMEAATSTKYSLKMVNADDIQEVLNGGT